MFQVSDTLGHQVTELLMRPHHHQYEKERSNTLLLPSLDLGRRNSTSLKSNVLQLPGVDTGRRNSLAKSNSDFRLTFLLCARMEGRPFSHLADARRLILLGFSLTYFNRIDFHLFVVVFDASNLQQLAFFYRNYCFFRQ